jgi:hypothetical protein
LALGGQRLPLSRYLFLLQSREFLLHFRGFLPHAPPLLDNLALLLRLLALGLRATNARRMLLLLLLSQPALELTLLALLLFLLFPSLVLYLGHLLPPAVPAIRLLHHHRCLGFDILPRSVELRLRVHELSRLALNLSVGGVDMRGSTAVRGAGVLRAASSRRGGSPPSARRCSCRHCRFRPGVGRRFPRRGGFAPASGSSTPAIRALAAAV